MKITTNTTLAAVAIGLTVSMQSANASLTSDTLANLVSSGGSLSIGDKTFSGFQYYGSGSFANLDASQINVAVSIDNAGVYYLTWSGLIQTTSAADLLLNYVVTASAGAISMIDQSYTGSGLLTVDETVSANGFYGQPLASSHLDGNVKGEFTGPNLYVNPAQSVLYVTKDIAMGTSDSVPLTTISQVSQSFHQTAVPEPSTVVAGALLLLPFGISTLRILRKGKAQA
jgi:hypothetical protein